MKIRYCDGASFAGHPESEVSIGLSRFKRGILPCYIWIYLMWVFFFFFRKHLIYTAERKWVVLQRPDHMGSYYEWTLINWHVESKTGYTRTSIHYNHIFQVFLLLPVLLKIMLLKIDKIISRYQFPILPLPLSYLKIKMISRWCILESSNMWLIFL